MPKKTPFVSICTPTFNRRPFIPMMIKCFENQTYPKNKLEWIIIDDGTDKIEDLVSHIPQVKYFKYDEKMSLGKKRNLSNAKSSGEIIVYMDDDDYYPPDRVSHAVEKLKKSPKALCAGSSAMFIYFKHINKMLQFGPYGQTHATAATFAFKRELLKKTKFSEDAAVAEEKAFLKNYTIPFVQLDPLKSILVFSHNHNSFDKKELLKNTGDPNIRETSVTPQDMISDTNILTFFMEEIDGILECYEPGRPENKPDVIKELETIRKRRETLIKEEMDKQNKYNETINLISMMSDPKILQQKVNEQSSIIQQLTIKNTQLEDKVNYLEKKLFQCMNENIRYKNENKNDKNDNDVTTINVVNLTSSDPNISYSTL